jgi:hypothetical protein
MRLSPSPCCAIATTEGMCEVHTHEVLGRWDQRSDFHFKTLILEGSGCISSVTVTFDYSFTIALGLIFLVAHIPCYTSFPFPLSLGAKEQILILIPLSHVPCSSKTWHQLFLTP